MDALHHLRRLIASLDSSLVDALCTRARRRVNESLYAFPDDPEPDLASLAAQFAAAPTLPRRAHLLRSPYLLRILPALCEPGEDKGQPSCFSADAACLDAFARRLALSVHVAVRKRESLPEPLLAAIRTRDPAQVELAITNRSVENEVVARVSARAAESAPRPDVPSRVAALYDEWLIPLSRKIQVCGLLA